ncbi:MAG: LPS assembly lipoprotein LptE [Roseibacillus sp.]
MHVPLATNSTQIPRAAAFVTNGVVDALVQDGTYRLGTAKDSDARLEVDFHTVDYRALRTAERNRLRAEELSMTVTLRWRVYDARDPLKVLDSGTSVGRTSLFVDPNLQTAQQSGISDAIKRASVSLVARLADGF